MWIHKPSKNATLPFKFYSNIYMPADLNPVKSERSIQWKLFIDNFSKKMRASSSFLAFYTLDIWRWMSKGTYIYDVQKGGDRGGGLGSWNSASVCGFYCC